MSNRQQTPEPGEGEFWIDLPPPAAEPVPVDESAIEAPAVSGDDPGAIFAPDRSTAEATAAHEDAPMYDAHPDEPEVSLAEQMAPVDAPGEPEGNAALSAAAIENEHAADDPAAESEMPGGEAELEEEGAAAFVPVLLGGALALAIAVGLEAAGLWSTLLPP